MKIRLPIKVTKKEDYVLIGFAVILATIMTTIGIIILKTPPMPQQITANPTPAVQQTPQTEAPQQTNQNTLTNPNTANPPIAYNISAQNTIIDKVTNHPTISQDDSAAKEKLLKLLPQGSDGGVIYSTSDFQIEYIQAFDFFQVEILTLNVQAAKNEANAWFRSQGVSQQGICNYPVDFYLNSAIATQLSNFPFIFSPSPNGC